MLEQVILKVAKEVVTRASVGPAFDVSTALKRALGEERSDTAKTQLEAILKNIELAEREKAAVCQDTGFPNFYIKLGDRFPIRSRLYDILTQAVREVTKELPLRPNTAHPFTEKNPGDNTGVYAPWFEVELFDGDYLEFHYVPKGGGTELPSKALTLPPGIAMRELPRLVLEAVVEAGPMPCPPVIVGVGIGRCTAASGLPPPRARDRQDGDRASKGNKQARHRDPRRRRQRDRARRTHRVRI